jgi:hypothetical protein
MSHPGLAISAACEDVASKAAKIVAFATPIRLRSLRNVNVIHLSLAAAKAAVKDPFYGSINPYATLCSFCAFNRVTGTDRAWVNPSLSVNAFKRFWPSLQALADLFALYGRIDWPLWAVERGMGWFGPALSVPAFWNLWS